MSVLASSPIVAATGKSIIWGVGVDGSVYICKQPCVGDWRPVEQVLAEGLGIEGVPPISYQERLAFVIRVRTERGGGEVEAEAEAEACTRQGCSPEGLAEQLGRQEQAAS